MVPHDSVIEVDRGCTPSWSNAQLLRSATLSPSFALHLLPGGGALSSINLQSAEHRLSVAVPHCDCGRLSEAVFRHITGLSLNRATAKPSLDGITPVPFWCQLTPASPDFSQDS